MISVSDCVVSAVEGRVRLRHPALKHAATADMAAAVVVGVEGVTKASVNPVTGSLLIFYDSETLSRDKLMELTNQFYTLIPHNFGRNRPPLIDSAEMLKKKMNMLEALADIEIAAHLVEGTKDEEEINQLTKRYEQSHIERRNEGKCAVEPSVIFIEMLWELERIGDHLANIAVRAPEIQKHYFAMK